MKDFLSEICVFLRSEYNDMQHLFYFFSLYQEIKKYAILRHKLTYLNNANLIFLINWMLFTTYQVSSNYEILVNIEIISSILTKQPE